MKLLEEKIKKDGIAVGTEIVKVDNFLNHRIDVALLRELGCEFARRFSACKPDKILTAEASGIAVAVFAAAAMGDIPVVFAKKNVPCTMTEDFYTAAVKSFTKGTVSTLCVAAPYLVKGERVLIIDDFLASGEAGLGLASLISQAGAECAGFGCAIEKYYQGGRRRLEELGIKVESLAVIASIKDGNIEFIN